MNTEIHDEIESISIQPVTLRNDTLDDNATIYYSAVSEINTVHHSTDSNDRVDHTLHSYDDVHNLGNEYYN